MKPIPGLTIETGTDGVRRVVVHVNPRDSSNAGFSLLLRALPALRDLDRLTREVTSGRRDGAERLVPRGDAK